MKSAITILIYCHASFGGIALLAGFVSIIVKKGGKLHKKSGLLFYYTMLLSTIIAMIVALLPHHQNPFLFAIGILSLYFTLTGKRALRFKSKNINLIVDKWISWTMISTGILMIFLPIILEKHLNIVLCVFAVIGILFSVRDLVLYNNLEKVRHHWLKLHLGKMVGAYISATTAFIVVNEFFSGVYGWFLPGLLGGFFIAYSITKLDKKLPPSS